ncbi:MAG: CoA transferase [Microthrixaceae bacterium]
MTPRDGDALVEAHGRNKRCIALDLKDESDLEVMRALCDGADVLVENFRPGTLERLGLDPDVLIERNPRLVVTGERVLPTGPTRADLGSRHAGRGSSGYAAIAGEPDGKPLLPPIALTDEVAALAAAFATMVAVHSGVGQVVDVNLLESMLQLMGPLVALYGTTGELQPRLSGGVPYTVPRNTYRCADGEWVAISTSAASVAERLMDLVGLHGEEVASFGARQANRELVDDAVSAWMSKRSLAEAMRELDEADVAAAPVYDMADIFRDEHFAARRSIVEVDGVPMQQLIARLSATPGRVRWAGRALDADGAQIREELG